MGISIEKRIGMKHKVDYNPFYDILFMRILLREENQEFGVDTQKVVLKFDVGTES